MLILIDSHVHIHQCYNLDEYFKNTFYNFSKIAAQFEKGKEWIGVLFLTETEGVNYFDLIKNSKTDLDSSKYKACLPVGKIENTSEENSFIISNMSADRQDSKEEKIIIIAGRQIIAKDGIEVLALGTLNNFEKNNSLEKTISEINESGAIAVLPWGVHQGFFSETLTEELLQSLKNNSAKKHLRFFSLL